MCDGATMRPLVYYCLLDLDESKRDRIAASLASLERLLALPPLGVVCSISPLPTEVEPCIRRALERPSFAECVSAVRRAMRERLGTFKTRNPNAITPPGLLAVCPPEHPVRKAAMAESGDAEWGLFNLGVAVKYDGPDVVSWHELLHIVGAEDCYALPDEGPTCGFPGCIMQYVPTDDMTRKDALPICSQNAERIRGMVAQLTEAQ
jgi:hypothetical protein